MGAALAAASLLWVFWGTLGNYLRDQHYQEHFLYLWVFLGLALGRTMRGPFRPMVLGSGRRDRVGLLLAVLSWMGFAAFELGGSNILGRTSLVLWLTACAVLAVPAWTIHRCLMHGLLMQLCFGLPYSIYYPLTAKLQLGVAQCMALPAKLGFASYQLDGAVVVFPHYRLAITADCSGFGQLLTFVGIAALGVLSSQRNPRRTLWLAFAAIALAWLSNLARVGLFVALVAWGATWSVDSPSWHQALGFLAFLPFVAALVGLILRTHRPWQPESPPPLPKGRMHVAWLVAPLLALHAWLGERSTEPLAEPAYFARLERPPGHALQLHGPSEANDKRAYETPWLLNARFADGEGRTFDLFHYATRSRSHLCVHRIADCIGAVGVSARYEPPVFVDGRAWWRIALDRQDAGPTQHVYFAFVVGGERRDDSWRTQLEVLGHRVLGGQWDVGLTRVMFDGPLPGEPGPREREVLQWLGRLVDNGADAGAPPR